MFNFDPSRQVSSSEQHFINDPASVVAEHLSHVGEPSAGNVQAAGDLMRTSYPSRTALGICIDLNSDVGHPTSTLAAMFAAQHEAIPRHWQTNPEIIRTVLTMCGHIEAGFLRAQQVDLAHEGGIPQIDTRLGEVEQLIAALQEK